MQPHKRKAKIFTAFNTTIFLMSYVVNDLKGKRYRCVTVRVEIGGNRNCNRISPRKQDAVDT